MKVLGSYRMKNGFIIDGPRTKSPSRAVEKLNLRIILTLELRRPCPISWVFVIVVDDGRDLGWSDPDV